ncbi:MAG: leucine-rich repeat domain-containing protein [Clostridia bacterium]|nr:leucine-rich repeat domain-containing protein [Clostridia bacterium]
MKDSLGEKELLNVDDDEWLIIDGVLEGCRIVDGVEEVRIPDDVIEISSYAFDSGEIKRIYVPMSVNTICECAFDSCWNVEEIYIENPNVILENGSFGTLEKLKVVYIGGQKIKVVVTEGEYGVGDERGNCIEKYLGTDECYTIDDDIKKIGEKAFFENATIKEVVIPSSVVEIDDEAFSNCSDLTLVNLPDTLEIIGSWVFNGCNKITEIKIPNSVYCIRDGAFGRWKSNQTIYVPMNLKKPKIFQKWRRGCKANIVYY